RSVVLYPDTVEPEKLRATAVYGGEMYAVRGSYDDCSRLVVELAGELDWAFVNVNLRAYYAEGSKTLAFEIAEQLGWRTAGAIYAVPEADVGPNMSLLAATTGVFGETAAGVTVGALRAAAAAGEIGEHDTVVVLVTGTGLKTPNVVDVRQGVQIDADVDQLL